MKRFSLAWLLTLTAGIAAAIAIIVSQGMNFRLRSEIDETVVGHENMVTYRDKELADARFGTSLLYKMALSGDHEILFKFLDTIPAESLSCSVDKLEDFPSIRLVSYSQHRRSPDGTLLPWEQGRSAVIMIKSDSLDVVDSVMHHGHCTATQFVGEYLTDWTLPDGKTVEYQVLPTGFRLVQ